MKTLMHMSMPCTRSDYYMKPAKPTLEQKAQIRNESTFPTVEFGMFGFKDQTPNRTGAKIGQLFTDKRALHLCVPNKISKNHFAVMELTEKVCNEDRVEEEQDILVYPHTKFDFFLTECLAVIHMKKVQGEVPICAKLLV